MPQARFECCIPVPSYEISGKNRRLVPKKVLLANIYSASIKKYTYSIITVVWAYEKETMLTKMLKDY